MILLPLHRFDYNSREHAAMRFRTRQIRARRFSLRSTLVLTSIAYLLATLLFVVLRMM